MNKDVIMSESWETLNNLTPNSQGNESLSAFIDFPFLFAKLNVQLLCGKGYYFETKDEKLKEFFNKFVKEAKFQQVLEKLVWGLSQHGKISVGFDIVGDGDYRMFPVSPKYLHFYQEVYEQLVGCYFINEKYFTTQQKLLMKERWDNEGNISRQYFFNNEQIPLGDFPTEIPKEFRLPEKDNWKSMGYKSIPFVLFKNYAFTDKPDWYPAKRMILTFNKMLERFERDLKVDKTFIIGRIKQAEKRGVENQIKNKIFETDLIIDTNTAGDEKKIAEIVNSKLDIPGRIASIKDLSEHIFNIAGYTYSDTSKGTDRTTATEVSINNSNQVHTIIRKRTSLNENMVLFLKKMFETKGFEKPDFIWRLSENTITSEQTLIDTIISQLQMKLMSQVEAICEIRTIPEAQAKAIADKINSENVYDEMLNPNNNEGGNNNDKKQNTKKSPNKKK